MMRFRKEQKIPKKPLRKILAAAVLVSNIFGCAASPGRTETICSSRGMIMYDHRLHEDPHMLTPEDREFLLRNNHVHMRCVTVPAR